MAERKRAGSSVKRSRKTPVKSPAKSAAAPKASRQRAASRPTQGQQGSADTSTVKAIPVVLYDTPFQGTAHDALQSVCAMLMHRLPALEGQLSPRPTGDVAAALEQDGPVVVVMGSFEASLAHSLATAPDSAKGLKDWQSGIMGLIALHRRNRRRLTMLDAGLFDRPDDPTWAIVAERVGAAQLGGEAADPEPQRSSTENGSRPAFDLAPSPYALAAAALIASDPETADLVSTLEAGVLGRQPVDMGQLVGATVQIWRDTQDKADLLRESLTQNLAALQGNDRQSAVLEESQEQLDLLRESLTQTLAVQQEREQQYAALEQKHQEMLRENQALVQDTARQNAALEESQEQLDLLRENLTLTLAALQEREQQHAALEQKQTLLRQEAARATLMLEAERTARTEQAQTAATAQKRRDAVLGAQILDLSADLSKQSSYAARLASDNARLSDRCQDQDATITALSNELDTVYGSKSWRATGPLRSLMARLKTNESP